MKTISLMVLTGIFFAPLNLSLAADNAPATQSVDRQKFKTGRAKAQSCTRCHGRKGIARLAESAGWTNSTGSFAKKGLIEFREGTRSNNIMSNIANGLTDRDIDDISYWLDVIDNK